MPKFKVRVRQYVEKVAETIVEADDEDDARNLVEGDAFGIDWNWEDGTDSGEFQIVKIELVKDPE